MYSKFLKAAVAATLVAAPLATMADSAPGEQKGDWIVRLGFSQVNPEAENLQPFGPVPGTGIPATTLVVDSDISPTFDVTYMFTNQFGVELLAAYPFTHGVDLKPFADGADTIRAGSVDHLPPTLSLVWRPFGYKADVQPYIGVGINYTMFSGEELRPSVLSAVGLPTRTELSLDDSVGAAGVIGVDLFPGEEKKWFMNAQVRYIQIESDAEILLPTQVNGVRAKVDAGTIEINPMVYGLHIGRRFGAPAPAAAPEPAPAPVVAPPPPPAPAKCVDSDNDGVCDEADKCPNTPAGAKVDKAGCPLEQTLKVLFDFDSAELRPESLTELERVVTFMNDVPFATALVEGHTDSVGTEEYNQALSDRRAKAVFDYLSSRGIDPARLKSIGHGELKPIADNATAEGRQMNRRVMLIRTDSGM